MSRVFHKLLFAVVWLACAGHAIAWRDIYPPETYIAGQTNRYHEFTTNLFAEFSYSTGVSNSVVTNWVFIYPWQEWPDGTEQIETYLSLKDALDMDASMAVSNRYKWISNKTALPTIYMFRDYSAEYGHQNAGSPLANIKGWLAANMTNFADPAYATSNVAMAEWFTNKTVWVWATNTVSGTLCDGSTATTWYAWELQTPRRPPTLSKRRLYQLVTNLPRYEVVTTTNFMFAFGWEANETNYYRVNTNVYVATQNTYMVTRTNLLWTWFDVTPFRYILGDGPTGANAITNLEWVVGLPYYTNVINACAPGYNINDYGYRHFRAVMSNFTYVIVAPGLIADTNDVRLHTVNTNVGFDYSYTNTWYENPCWVLGQTGYSCAAVSTNDGSCQDGDGWQSCNCEALVNAYEDIALIDDPAFRAQATFAYWTTTVDKAFSYNVSEYHEAHVYTPGGPLVLYSGRKTVKAALINPLYYASANHGGIEPNLTGTLVCVIQTTKRDSSLTRYCLPYFDYDTNALECVERWHTVTKSDYGQALISFTNRPIVSLLTNAVGYLYDTAPEIVYDTPTTDGTNISFYWSWSLSFAEPYAIIEIEGEYK